MSFRCLLDGFSICLVQLWAPPNTSNKTFKTYPNNTPSKTINMFIWIGFIYFGFLCKIKTTNKNGKTTPALRRAIRGRGTKARGASSPWKTQRWSRGTEGQRETPRPRGRPRNGGMLCKVLETAKLNKTSKKKDTNDKIVIVCMDISFIDRKYF